MQRRSLIRWFAALAAAPALKTAGDPLRPPRRRSLLVLDARIAGFAYYDGARFLPDLMPGAPLRLHREPSNAHDPRAIEVFWNDRKIGYVPRLHNRALCRLMDTGETVTAEIKRVDPIAAWEPLYFTASVLV